VISFVVPCYNYARFLPECVESILKLEGDFDWELILIDDASTDNTREVIRSFSDSRVRVISHKVNLGHAGTMNEGLGAARGEFIARLDPDDRYRPGFLSAVMGKFESFPEVGLVYGDVALIDARGQITAGRTDREHGGRDFKGNELIGLLARNFICAPSVIARRQAWLGVAPVPAHLAFNDWYFTVMMARRHEFYYVDQVIAEYRVHDANHHAAITRTKQEEPSVLWVLEQVFSSREEDVNLERAKQQARRRVFAVQYLDLANKYFGMGLDGDARRCYLRALGYAPSQLLRPDVFRHVLGTLVGRRLYESSKSIVKTAVRAVSGAPR
jgi:glycosyltransferase involved in cell wall biosynthesis